MEKIADKQVNLKFGEIELPKIDIKPYIGKKATIESANTYSGQYGYYVKVLTNIVEIVGKGEKAVELRGSRIFGLQQDAEGVWGYGKDTKLGLFLARMKVKNVDDLVGKEVVLQAQVSDNGTEFLSFL